MVDGLVEDFIGKEVGKTGFLDGGWFLMLGEVFEGILGDEWYNLSDMIRNLIL